MNTIVNQILKTITNNFFQEKEDKKNKKELDILVLRSYIVITDMTLQDANYENAESKSL